MLPEPAIGPEKTDAADDRADVEPVSPDTAQEGALGARRERSLPLLAVFIGFGAVVLLFAFFTVHRRTEAELIANPASFRTYYETSYWLHHGYFNAAGLRVRRTTDLPVYFYRSSTGGVLLGGFIVQKVYLSITGHYGWHAMALFHQTVVALTSALLGLLAFRLARRIEVRPLHAMTFGIALQAVYFTFPDNLMAYWELNSRIPWLFCVCIFLLVEERCSERRTRFLTFVQGAAAFFMTYVEFAAGPAFLISYMIIGLLVGYHDRSRSAKRLLLTAVMPMLLAFAFYVVQIKAARAMHPDVPVQGSTFLFRTGLDGSTRVYGNHLDIAFRRDPARANWPTNASHLFRWPWLFFAGVTALVSVLLAAVRGRVPVIATLSLLSLLGAYLSYAALFSQAVVIHPYYYDVMLLTPLALALFVLAPAVFERMSVGRGVIAGAVFFLAVWVSMVQLRRYAIQFPLPPAETQTR